MSYTNHDVMHAWANWSPLAPVQSRSSSNGNYSFNGRDLFSYNTLIARHVSTIGDKRGRIAFVTTRSYSVTTTGKHMPRHHVFPASVTVFYVDDVDARDDQRANYRGMLADVDAEISRLSRARAHTNPERLESLVCRANKFRAAFGIRLKAASIPTDFGAHLDALKANHAKQQAKQAKRRAAEAKERARKDAERLEEWLAGSNNVIPPAMPVMFRVIERDGERLVESTMRARVPFDAALSVAKLATACAKSGNIWDRTQRASDRLRVGDFQLDRIGADGTVTIGCHTFTLAEIQRAASVAGVQL